MEWDPYVTLGWYLHIQYLVLFPGHSHVCVLCVHLCYECACACVHVVSVWYVWGCSGVQVCVRACACCKSCNYNYTCVRYLKYVHVGGEEET